MSKNSKITNNGRITYITPDFSDPNNYTSRDEKYGMDNITFDHEDYCISVDLQVIVPDRLSCGSVDYSSSGQKTYEFTLTSDRNYASFMNGRTINDINGNKYQFLTAENSDSTSQRLKSDNDNKENLGIESIDVEFNHYMYPVVTIRFIDVRGYSLMMPEENSFANRLKNNDYNQEAKSFFNALFRFPYPIFLLKIKGFYGDAVTFQLAVNEFKSSFDSSTGNFIITVTFIGYMYGLYGDLPMKYLFAAPYDEYCGSQYWDTQNFTFDDGTKIPKIDELLRNISEASNKIEQVTNQNPNIVKSKQYTQQIDSLKNILSNYTAFIDSLGGGVEQQIVGKKYILVLGYVKNNNEVLGIYDTNAFKRFYESVENYNSNGWEQIEIPNNDRIGVKYVMDEVFSVQQMSTEDNKSDIGIVFLYKTNSNLNDWLTKISEDEVLNNLIGVNGIYEFKNIKKLYNRYGYLYYENGFRSKIERKINELTEAQKKLNELISNYITTKANDIIGFKPSIKNVYKLIFSYLETFLSSYYSCLNNVKQSNRTFSDLGIDISQADIKTNTSNNVFVPPFPLITANNTEMWPGNLPKGNVMPEVSFINGILNGIVSNVNSLNSINSYINKNEDKVEFSNIPINLTDLFMQFNPYNYGLNKSENNKLKIGELLSYFGIRAINYLSFQTKNKVLDTTFGECEAYNFYLSHPIYDDMLMNLLDSSTCSGDLLVKMLNNEENEYSLNNEQFYALKNRNHNKEIIKDGKYNWIINGKKIILPVNFKTFNDIDNVLGSLTNDSYINDANYHNMFLDTYSEDSNNAINERINNNVFAIFKTSYEDIIHLKENVLKQDINYIKDKEKIFNNWNVSLEKYVLPFKNNKTISIKAKNGNPSIAKHSNLFFIDDSYDNSIALYNINPIKFSNFFNFKNNNVSETVEELLSNKLDSNEYFLPTLQINGDSSLYGNGFLYLQNEGYDDEKIKMYRKSLLLLHSLPYSYSTIKNYMKQFDTINQTSTINLIPKGILLLIGGLLWRKQYCIENNITDVFNYGNVFKKSNYNKLLITNSSNKNLSLCIGRANEDIEYINVEDLFSFGTYQKFSIFDLRDEVKNCLIKGFEEWSNSYNGFRTLNDYLELKLLNNREIKYNTLDSIKEIWKLFNNNYNTLLNNRENKLLDNFKTILNVDNINFNVNTVYDALIHIFDRKTFETYCKIGVSGEEVIPSFMLLHNANSRVNNLLLNLFIEPIPIYISRFVVKSSDIKSIFIDETSLKENFNAFKNTLKKLYNVNEQSNINNNVNYQIDSKIDDDIRNSSYLTMKNLYDRWLCSSTNERWKLSSKNSYFNDFNFVDSHYNNIGDDLIVNCDILFDLFTKILKSPSTDIDGINFSVYEVLSSIAEQSNCLLMALPVSNSFNSPNKLYNMFTPYPYNSTSISGYEIGTSFICMHTFVPSTNLNIDDETNSYKNDGFDISNILSSTNEGIPEDMLSGGDGKYSIPSFGVTYGRQNQNFFKRIDVNMDNPSVTEQSIANTLLLAKAGEQHGTNNSVVFKGQDLYDIYANRSYTCNVEMMGCALIMPLIYFQLNNIPLFRGAYMIIKTKHHIEAGNMTTTFTGVRINRNKLPINKDIFTLLSLQNRLNNVTSTGITTVNDSSITYNNNTFKSDYIKPKTLDDGLNESECNIMYCYDEVSKLVDKNGLPLIIFSIGDLKESGGPKVAFDNLTTDMRKLIVEIARTVDYNTNYKLYVTSLRRFGSGRSDHNKGFAADLHGCEINSNGEVVDRKKYSAQLFDLIATTFTPYIKQLIWENKTNDVSYYRLDKVDNCIHFSSDGYRSSSDVQIFQADNYGKRIIPILDGDNFYPLSEAFLATSAFLVSKGIIGLNNITNFAKSKMTNEEYKNKLLKYNVKRI